MVDVLIDKEALKAMVPDSLKGFVDAYGHTILEAKLNDVIGWVGLHLTGDHDEAYEAMLKVLSIDDLLAEGESLIAGWNQLNATAEEKAAKVRVAKQALFQIALTLLFARTGLPLSATPSNTV